MLEALLGLPLRERSVPWMLHGDLAVSLAAPETTAPVGSGRGRQAAAIAYYPEGSPGFSDKFGQMQCSGLRDSAPPRKSRFCVVPTAAMEQWPIITGIASFASR